MPNMLIPVEERNLTPDQVVALDKRRQRGLMLQVMGAQFGFCRHSADCLGWTGFHLFPGWIHPMGYYMILAGTLSLTHLVSTWLRCCAAAVAGVQANTCFLSGIAEDQRSAHGRNHSGRRRAARWTTEPRLLGNHRRCAGHCQRDWLARLRSSSSATTIGLLAQELASKKAAKVYALECATTGRLHLRTPTSHALKRISRHNSHKLVLLPHTYQVRDFAPRLALALGRR